LKLMNDTRTQELIRMSIIHGLMLADLDPKAEPELHHALSERLAAHMRGLLAGFPSDSDEARERMAAVVEGHEALSKALRQFTEKRIPVPA
jgi:hypothetical protein